MMWRNKRTLALVFWVMMVVLMIAVMPNLNKLVLEKGQVTIPETTQSEQGAKLLNEYTADGEKTFPYALVFHNEEGLTSEEQAEIKTMLAEIQADEQELNIVDSLFHTDNEQAAAQLVAEDGTTILTQLTVTQSGQTAEEVAEKLRSYLDDASMEAYVTGSDLVLADFTNSTQEGVKKTEIIAIVFIIIILTIIFRSPIVPIISLVTVGVSYIVSLGIIALLVEHSGLAFSNFTQVFLVVILFGVGTDYNILLFTRFKEEMAKQDNVVTGILNTYKTAGKTVIYSGLAVLVGFVALFFAQFSVYQATATVAIGIAVLLLVLLTLTPFFMGILGLKLFWPIKEVQGHGENKLWAKLSKFGFMRPILGLVVVSLATIPFIISYSNTLNYNDLTEINNKYESKQAVTIIEQHYEAGFSSPVSLLIKSDESLATQEKLAEIDALTEVIQNVDGVAKVYSVTRPEGEKISELYMNDQSRTLNDGIDEAKDGVDTIQSGLTEAEQEVGKPQDLTQVQQLIDGTQALHEGAEQLQAALGTLGAGLGEGADGATQIASNLETLTSSTTQLKNGVAELSTNYAMLHNGFQQFNQLFTQTGQAIEQAKQGYQQIEGLLTKALVATPDSVELQTALQIAKQAQVELEQGQGQLNASMAQYEQLTRGLQQANAALNEVENGVAQIEQGSLALSSGANELSTSLQQAENGTNQLASRSTDLVSGLDQVKSGQQTIQTNLNELQDQMKELEKGLADSTEGLSSIYDGLDESNQYLAELTASETNTFFIPQEVLEGEDFAESKQAYFNDDEYMTRMTIILEVNPYGKEAMEIASEIDTKVQSYQATVSLVDDEVKLAGKTIANVDLQTISQEDFIRSAIFMVLGILLILLWVTRSMFQTLIILGALLVTNFAALGLTEIVAVNLLGYEALSWNVPFFTLIMLVTLGVDYGIFFMMRYNELKKQGYSQIIPAAADMGGVIISAAIILGGTFAALMPSGIITLIQVAISVMIGLLLLSVIVMPILLPACFGFIEKIQKLMKKNK